MSSIVTRSVDDAAAARLVAGGLSPFMARIYAARGISRIEQLAPDLSRLIPLNLLCNVNAMAELLADAITAHKKLLIVADYDADGATACAVGLRALRMFGANVDYLVPNRFEYGYGLTPEIVRLAASEKKPDVLITVDNGIASIDGVAEANRLGMKVLVTDHHLPGDSLPDAWCIINPNQPGCTFPSKNLAGVGVMFYLMLALRAEFRKRGVYADKIEPNLGTLLDLVALGTVADVVKLDDNNRLLVQQGLQRIRAGRAQQGINALFNAAGREPSRAATYDLGFVAGPRLNAAGRLTDMSLGIECLTTDDPERASALAQQLDAINRQRREVEADMRLQAELLLEQVLAAQSQAEATPSALVLYDPAFHEGVVGIVAGRLKDRLHRPTFVLARGQDGLLKGSGRSIPGFHLRDALDLVSKRHPGLLQRFGGHAMAAGCTLGEADWPLFASALQQVASEWLLPETLNRCLATDGPLAGEYFNVSTVATLDAQVWGQGFEAPLFCDEVEVLQQRLVGEKHLKLRVRHAGQLRDAIWFGHAEPLPPRVRLAYRLNLDEYQGQPRLQMVVEAASETRT